MMSQYIKALAIYILIEVLFYKFSKIYFSNVHGKMPDYQEWVYYFYFPEKKLIFYYFLIFLLSSWVYWSIYSFYFLFKRQVSNA
jgi:hypothetical protein